MHWNPPPRVVHLNVLAMLLCSATVAVAEKPTLRLDPDLPYRAQRSDPVTHEVDFSVVITPPYHCEVLKVWLPLPQTDFGQQISDFELTTFPDDVEPEIHVEPVYGNKFAYFEFHEPKGGRIIRNRFTATVWNLHWNVDPAEVESVSRWPEAFEKHLVPQQIAAQEDFDRLLAELVPQPRSAASDLRNIMDWIDENLTYDHGAASLRADADHAFDLRRGHCSDYHGLCATMVRALGYPTRVTYGLALFPKNSPSHCKLEAFLPPYGWVSYDLSETQKLVQAISADETLSEQERRELTEAARRRLHAGFRENSWLLVTRGTQYELAPPASQPVPVVRTIYAEADGEPLPDPDPADAAQRKFAWMTVHRYQADRPFTLPFRDIDTLRDDIPEE